MHLQPPEHGSWDCESVHGIRSCTSAGMPSMLHLAPITTGSYCAVPADMRGDVQQIFKATPHSKQVMMFSATLAKEIRPVCKKFMNEVRLRTAKAPTPHSPPQQQTPSTQSHLLSPAPLCQWQDTSQYSTAQGSTAQYCKAGHLSSPAAPVGAPQPV